MRGIALLILHVLLLLAQPAWAIEVPAEHARTPEARRAYLVDQVTREICALTGRCRDAWPALEVVDRETATFLLWEEVARAHHARTGETLELDARVDLLPEVAVFSEHALATYLRESDRVLLVQESLEDMRRRYGLDETELDDVTTCLIAHEYVHALQGAHVPDRTSIARRRLDSVLAEGHATHVTARLCERWFPDADYAALIDTITSADQPRFDVDASPQTLGYSHARHWLADQLADSGEEAAWDLLAEPPLTLDDLLAHARRHVPAAWHTPGGLTRFVHARIDAATTEAWTPSDGLDTLNDRLQSVSLPLDPTPSHLDGWRLGTTARTSARGLPVPVAVSSSLARDTDGDTYQLSAFLFAEADDAQRALARRRVEADRQQAEAHTAGGPFRAGTGPRRLRRHADEVLTLRYGEDDLFEEVWARRGTVLVSWVGARTDVRHRVVAGIVAEALERSE